MGGYEKSAKHYRLLPQKSQELIISRMYLPPLQPVTNSEIRICGDVEIHPSASIAPGVVLQATSNSRIIIGVDVCLGMGVIINAHNGNVEICDGATLGSGVLIVGYSHVGKNACLGTSTTVFNSSVEAMKVVPPGSILGCNPSFNKASPPSSETEAVQKEDLPTSENIDTGVKNEKQGINIGFIQGNQRKKLGKNTKTTSPSDNNISPHNININNEGDPWKEEEIRKVNFDKVKPKETVEKENKSITIGTNITIGKGYIEELIGTLFPHKKNL